MNRFITWVRARDHKEFVPYEKTENSTVHPNGIEFERNTWIIDNGIPIFTKDREYIIDTMPYKKELWK